jgi:co-chaperonin GroES (HSP10)
MKKSKLAGLILLSALVFGPVTAGAQGFGVLNSSAQQGMLMSLSPNPQIIEPASDKNAQSLVGILDPNDTSLDLQSGQVNVKTSGVSNALVSTLNGDVSTGDRIAPSSIEGIGAKVDGNSWIVGTAQGSLTSKTKDAIKSDVTDTAGKKQSVYIARIPVVIKVTYYNASTNSSSIVPQSIQSFADKLAGKHVKPWAIILSFLLIVMGVLLAAQLINSAIRSGMAAIARQPLTKALILPKILQTFAVALSIVLVVIAASYMLLHFF